jgi:hypothetical protein
MDESGPVDSFSYRSIAEETASVGAPGCVFTDADASVLAVARRSLPSFFIVGPPRTGSSWLYEIFSSRVALPAPSKETRFFDVHFDRGLKWYLAHYKNSGAERRVGEVAPTYFASPRARERLSQTVPDARIVCVFRNPTERIISLYRLKRAYGLIPWGFEEAMQRDPELLETSRYASNLKLWQRSFGAANVLACLYDDLRENPQGFVNGLADFVGVPRFSLRPLQTGSVHDSERMTQPRSYSRTRMALLVADWFKSRRLDRVVSEFKQSSFCKFVLGGGCPFPPVPSATVELLYEKFRPEVDELEEILQRDLSSWKYPKVRTNNESNVRPNEGAGICA